MCICCSVTRPPIQSLFGSIKGSFQPINAYCRYMIPPIINTTNPKRCIGMDSDTEVQLSYWQSETLWRVCGSEVFLKSRHKDSLEYVCLKTFMTVPYSLTPPATV